MEKRVCVLYFSILICLWLLSTRLYFICVNSDGIRKVLDGQYSSRLDIAERSGFIYDRYFRLLSHDKNTGILLIDPSLCEDIPQVTSDISKIAKVAKQSELIEKIHTSIPFTVSVNDEEKAEELCRKYPGLYYCPIYSENNHTAQHLLGYSSNGYGVTGLRKAYAELLYERLYAKNGAVFYSDAKNQIMAPLTFDDASYNSTDGIITTIDMPLQSVCDSLEEQIVRGCVIVADAHNGEILAMSSFPSYDGENISQSLDSDNGELLNRAAYSFTPGSVFKIAVSAAALETDLSYYDFTHNCTGSIQVDNTMLRCHKRDGHGEISMNQAFAVSCNCYYISLAKQIGMEQILDTCRKMGLDNPSSADFLTEANHSFMDDENYSDTYLSSIAFGQADLCLSPLDMIKMMICSVEGEYTELSLIRGKVIGGKAEFVPQKEKNKVFSDKTTQLLCSMMEECVNTGTGKTAKIEGKVIGGKTATAQTGRKDVNGVEYVHKWFCGFYEGIENRYVFCILCEITKENNLSPGVTASVICSYMKENWY